MKTKSPSPNYDPLYLPKIKGITENLFGFDIKKFIIGNIYKDFSSYRVFLKLHVSAFTIEVTQYKAEFRHGTNCREHRHIHFQRVQIAFVDRL